MADWRRKKREWSARGDRSRPKTRAGKRRRNESSRPDQDRMDWPVYDPVSIDSSDVVEADFDFEHAKRVERVDAEATRVTPAMLVARATFPHFLAPPLRTSKKMVFSRGLEYLR